MRQTINSWFGLRLDGNQTVAITAIPNSTAAGVTQSKIVKNYADTALQDSGDPIRPDIDPLPDETGEAVQHPNFDLQHNLSPDQALALAVDSGISGDSVLATTTAEAEPMGSASDSGPDAGIDLADYLTAMDIRNSRYSALQDAMDLWQTPVEVPPYMNSLDDDQAFFRLTAKPHGVFMHRIETDLAMLKRLNLPAIMELFPTGGEEPGFLTLSRIEGDNYIFGSQHENPTVVANAEQVKLYWSGVAYLPWKNFLSIKGTIPKFTNKDSIITLKLLLHDLGFSDVEINDEYDAWTRQAIQEVQAKYGIPVDGFVGPLTKMILYQEKDTFEMPSLIN